MSFANALAHLRQYQLEEKVREFSTSSATVELAAQALGCLPAHIAKSLSFKTQNDIILIVTAGDARVDNKKYKLFFDHKPKMLTASEVSEYIGHDIGGVCPFGIQSDVKVYLDIALKRFDTVYPACGSSNSCVELNLQELAHATPYEAWVDVCKDWQ